MRVRGSLQTDQVKTLGTCRVNLQELDVGREREGWRRAYNSTGEKSGEVMVSLMLSEDNESVGVDNYAESQKHLYGNSGQSTECLGYLERLDRGLWQRFFFTIADSKLFCYSDAFTDSDQREICQQWDLACLTVNLLPPDATLLWWGFQFCFVLEVQSTGIALSTMR